jgi:hypothetical protein
MTGDSVQDGRTTTQSSNDGSLFHGSGFIDKWHAVQKGATDLAHKGLEASRKFANGPTGRQIQKEATEAGKEVYDSHKQKVMGVVHGVQSGDIREVVKNGAPLAGEAILGPVPAATLIAKQKLAETAVKHLPPQHQETARKAQTIIEHHGFPKVDLSGVIGAAARQQVRESATTEEQKKKQKN